MDIKNNFEMSQYLKNYLKNHLEPIPAQYFKMHISEDFGGSLLTKYLMHDTKTGYYKDRSVTYSYTTGLFGRMFGPYEKEGIKISMEDKFIGIYRFDSFCNSDYWGHKEVMLIESGHFIIREYSNRSMVDDGPHSFYLFNNKDFIKHDSEIREVLLRLSNK